MPLPVWICLAFVLLSLTLGAAWIFRAGRRFWGDLKILGRRVDGTTAAAGAALERLAERSAGFGAGFPRLEGATASLRVSLARLAVLQAALGDVRDAVGRVAAVYPRK